jgi:hypothetical protein
MTKLASSLRIAALLAAVAGVLFAIVAATISDPQSTLGVFKISVDDSNASGLPWALRSIVTVGPALTFAYAMWQLAKLLKLAAIGEVFSAPAAAHLRSFGAWLLVTTVLQVSLGFVVKALYLWLSDAEHGRLDLTLHSSNLWNLFISALFMLVARVLADAYVIAEENKQII